MRLMAARPVLSVLALAAAVTAASAETTRTLRAELSADAIGHFAVENLAGTMRIVPSAGRTVVAVATVHAESDALAGSMKFEQVAGRQGVPTLRVVYPLDEEKTIRYPGRAKEGRLLERMFGGSSTSTEYDGHKVKVSETSGVLLYADVDVQVPRHLDNAVFRDLVGFLEGNDLEGRILFDTGSGDVTLASVKGDIKVDTGSGDVKVTDAAGSFSCATGSGDCDLTGFSGDTLHCDVGSGDVTLRKTAAHRLDIDTGSGNVRVTEGDIEEFVTATGSGDVRLENHGRRLVRVKADTGSGDVVLRLAPDATFEALADQGSGDIMMRYKDAQPIVRHKEVIGYRRGEARTKIDVDTGSGDLTIEPGA
jgi:putative adhesin